MDTEDRKQDEPVWRRVFLGPCGIRAGWSAVIFLVVAAGVLFGENTILKQFVTLDHSQPATAVRTMLVEGASVLAVFVATSVMAFIERRSVLSYGFRGSRPIRRFISGAVIGFVALSALVEALGFAGYLTISGMQSNTRTMLESALLWAAASLLVALFEESLFRGYLQHTLARGLGFWWSALLLSIAFGMAHAGNAGESWMGVWVAGSYALVFCLSLRLTGALFWAVGFHMAFGWAETYFYGVADSGVVAEGHLLSSHPTGPVLWSGGATGPEGSILAIPLALAIALGMWLAWGNAKQKACEPIPGVQK